MRLLFVLVLGATANGGFLAALAVDAPREHTLVAEPAPSAPVQSRGLDFRRYVALQRGMSEGVRGRISEIERVRRF